MTISITGLTVTSSEIIINYDKGESPMPDIKLNDVSLNKGYATITYYQSGTTACGQTLGTNFAKFAVTNDSGPMHILSSGNIPIFGIFGPSDWVRNHALGQEKYVVTPNKLSASASNGTNLSELTPSQVIKFIEKTLC